MQAAVRMVRVMLHEFYHHLGKFPLSCMNFVLMFNLVKTNTALTDWVHDFIYHIRISLSAYRKFWKFPNMYIEADGIKD